jgi:hypothetical protein
VLPIFPRERWAERVSAPLPWMGRPDLDEEPEHGRRQHPPEDIDAEGCPGAWYRTPFVASLRRYLRRSDGKGGRVNNRFYDTCDDRLVLECVHMMEAAEEASLAELYRAAESE